MISGYLIFRVIDKVYSSSSVAVARFYINRFLRIFPLYIIVALATFILAIYFNDFKQGVGAGNGFDRFYSQEVMQWPSSFLGTIRHFLAPGLSFQVVPWLSFSSVLIPQGWTIGIELGFYLFAPIMVLLIKWKKLIIFPIVLGSLVLAGVILGACSDVISLDFYFYKNFFSGLLFFVLGGCAYFLKIKNKNHIIYYISTSVLGGVIILLAAPFHAVLFGREPVFEIFLLGMVLLLMLMFTILINTSDAADGGGLSFLGNLSYGIYLNHMLVIAVLSSIDSILINNWIAQNSLSFCYLVVLVSSLCAIGLFNLVEKPLGKLRLRIREPLIAVKSV